MDVFGRLSEMISKVGYEPISQSQTSKSTYTLHTAIRDVCDMTKHETKNQKDSNTPKSTKPQEVHIIADEADVSYWDFLKLRDYLKKITELIDAELSLIVDKQTHFASWDHEITRTKNDILSLLKSLSKKYPDLPTPPKAISRPQARDMIGRGKIESAIANTLAVLAGNGMQYGDLFENIASKSSSNEELLNDLDSQIQRHNCDRLIYDKQTMVPRSLVQAYLKFKDTAELGTDRNCTLAKFLRSMSTTNNFSGNSDETLIKRLNAVWL